MNAVAQAYPVLFAFGYWTTIALVWIKEAPLSARSAREPRPYGLLHGGQALNDKVLELPCQLAFVLSRLDFYWTVLGNAKQASIAPADVIQMIT